MTSGLVPKRLAPVGRDAFANAVYVYICLGIIHKLYRSHQFFLFRSAGKALSRQNRSCGAKGKILTPSLTGKPSPSPTIKGIKVGEIFLCYFGLAQ